MLGVQVIHYVGDVPFNPQSNVCAANYFLCMNLLQVLCISVMFDDSGRNCCSLKRLLENTQYLQIHTVPETPPSAITLLSTLCVSSECVFTLYCENIYCRNEGMNLHPEETKSG
jgi:hypothetical protein